MTTALNKDSKIVLKLDLCEDGVRRIPLKKLWDESTSCISYSRLIAQAVELKGIKPKAVENGRISLSTTYMDEDGDEITISTDEELGEAFGQFLDTQPPVVRAKIVTMKKDKGAKLKPQERNCKLKKTVAMRATAPTSTSPSIRTEPVASVRTVPVRAAPIPVAKAVLPPKDPPAQPTSTPDISDLDPNFIHGRHTCDGCLTTPILGFRYHAINHPDYDLCSNCFPKYKGELSFKPQELDRDRHLQNRWQWRQKRRCRSQNVRFTSVKKCGDAVSGTQTKKVIDGMDDDLKEAIRRSLMDDVPAKKQETASASAAPTACKEPEIDVAPETEKEVLPLGSVVQVTAGDELTQKFLDSPNMNLPDGAVMEVTAGDEKTQKALDAMDPETKESLSRSLNDCIANRSSCVTTAKETDLVSEVTMDNGLSPTQETKAKLDTMDDAVKEAVRRSLTDFFASRTSEKPIVEPTKKEDVEVMDVETREAVRRSLNDFIGRRGTETKMDAMQAAMKEAIRRSLTGSFTNRVDENASSTSTSSVPTKPVEEENAETMDVETKEAVRRSLEDFFFRRKTDAETKEAIRNSINDLLVRRKSESSTETKIAQPNEAEEEMNETETPSVAGDIVVNDDDEEANEIETPSVAVDISVNDDDDLSEGMEEEDDDDLSEGTEDNLEGTNEDEETIVSGNDELDAGTETIESTISENNDEKKDDWHMVDQDMIAAAAQMLGSALFHSDASLTRRSDPSV